MTEEIDLSCIVPLIALPSSPGSVVPVQEVVGRPVEQVVIGPSVNRGLRDLTIVDAIVTGRQSHPGASFDVDTSFRQILQHLSQRSGTLDAITAEARLHQAG